MKIEQLYEVAKPQMSKEVAAFKKAVETAYKREIPKGWIDVRLTNGLGQYLGIVFGVQPKSKHSGGYMDNDPGLHKILIHDMSDGNFPEKIVLDIAQGGGLLVKPAEGSYMAYDRVKFGWRKKSGNIAQVQKHLENYFKKMKKVLADNKDNLAHDLG